MEDVAFKLGPKGGERVPGSQDGAKTLEWKRAGRLKELRSQCGQSSPSNFSELRVLPGNWKSAL